MYNNITTITILPYILLFEVYRLRDTYINYLQLLLFNLTIITHLHVIVMSISITIKITI